MTDATEPMTGEEARALATSVDAFADRLADRLVPRDEFDRNRRNIRIALAVGAVAVAVLVWVAWQQDDTTDALADTQAALVTAQQDLAEVAQTNRDLIDGLAECTTPTPPDDAGTDPHECYEAGQERQADLLATVFDTVGVALDRLGDRVISAIEDRPTSG